MKTDLTEIQQALKDLMLQHVPPLKVRIDKDTQLELCGTKEAMQGKQKVDGFYFGSVIPKPKDVRLYYFPIYTHVDAFGPLSAELQKCLKGKSCFHIKKLTPEMEQEIAAMIKHGVELYLKDGLV